MMHEHTASSAIERLLAATHGMIAKRIDLAILEGQQISQRLLISAALSICGMMVAAAAILSLGLALTLVMLPESTTMARALLFGGINVVVAALLIVPALEFAKPRPAENGHTTNGAQAEVLAEAALDESH